MEYGIVRKNDPYLYGDKLKAYLLAGARPLRAAAASMEMAYSKAWRIIRTAEAVFGCKMLESTIGGKHGGGAVLTPQAEQLLEAYNAYVADVEAYCQGKFEESFGFYRDLNQR